MMPSHLPKLPPDSNINDLLKGVDEKDAAQFYVLMDGKPSDRYVKDGKYCLVMLTASSINTFISLGERINNALKSKGFKFRKISHLRKKRRVKYANSVLDILIDISIKEKGLRYNFRVAAGSAEVMNPKNILKYIEDNESMRELFNAELHDNHIIFKYDNKEIKVGHDEFGGMIWWHANLLQIAAQYKTEERNISWWLHMDRLPLDHNLEKTKLFGSMMDHFFYNKLWMSVSGNDELAIDIFPDFYAYIYYEAMFNRENIDLLLLEKLQTLEMLNTKEYWSDK